MQLILSLSIRSIGKEKLYDLKESDTPILILFAMPRCPYCLRSRQIAEKLEYKLNTTIYWVESQANKDCLT